jgi:mRNA interferase MazF
MNESLMNENNKNLFEEWSEQKQNIYELKKFRHPKEGEIWWCSVGVNIGQEILGKGRFFTRPVLVVAVRETGEFIGVPLSSKIKKKKFSKIIETQDSKKHLLHLLKIRSYDNRRLRTRIYLLNKALLEEIKEEIRTII